MLLFSLMPGKYDFVRLMPGKVRLRADLLEITALSEAIVNGRFPELAFEGQPLGGIMKVNRQ